MMNPDELRRFIEITSRQQPPEMRFGPVPTASPTLQAMLAMQQLGETDSGRLGEIGEQMPSDAKRIAAANPFFTPASGRQQKKQHNNLAWLNRILNQQQQAQPQFPGGIFNRVAPPDWNPIF